MSRSAKYRKAMISGITPERVKDACDTAYHIMRTPGRNSRSSLSACRLILEYSVGTPINTESKEELAILREAVGKLQKLLAEQLAEQEAKTPEEPPPDNTQRDE